MTDEITCPICGSRPWEEFEVLGGIESWRSVEHNRLHYRTVLRHSCGRPVGLLWSSSSIAEFDAGIIEGPDEYLGEYIHCGDAGFLYREGGKLIWEKEKRL